MFAVQRSEKFKVQSSKLKNKYLYITLLAVLGWHAEAQGQKGARAVPRLVVNITVDQLRSDYLELFAPTFGAEGFARLLEQGMVFEQASYPFQHVDKMSAISSVVTGTTPFYHTIIGEQWIDRNTLRPVSPTTADLAVSTIGDELKMATEGQGKVCAIATTKEMATLAGGHNADAALWQEHGKKRWTSADITTQAIQVISQKVLGQDSIPDLLLLTYDASGRDQQTYTLLDQEIARLIADTEKQVGTGNTLYILTSTGYSEHTPIDYERYHIPTGTFYINRAANLLNMYFGGLWGTGKYVEAHFKNQIYLNLQLLESKRITIDEATRRAKEFLLQMAGVKKVEIHLFEAHYGDLVIQLAPGWQLLDENTHQQINSKSDLAYFPIIVFGTGIQSASVQTPVTIDRIAPAIARTIRIRAPNACFATPLF